MCDTLTNASTHWPLGSACGDMLDVERGGRKEKWEKIGEGEGGATVARTPMHEACEPCLSQLACSN